MTIYYILEEISYGGSEVVDGKFYSSLKKATEELKKLCLSYKGEATSEVSFLVNTPYGSCFSIVGGKLIQ